MNTTIFHNLLKGKNIFLFFVVLLLALVPLASLPPASATSLQSATPTANFDIEINSPSGAAPIKVLAPAQANVGDRVTLTVLSAGAKDLAGFQFAILFDDASLTFASGKVDPGFGGAGTSPFQMGPVDLTGKVLLGAAACPVADCSAYNYASAPRSRVAVNGEAALATISFIVQKAGTHQVIFDELKMVDFQGNSLVSGKLAAQPSQNQLDVNGNGFINVSDAVGIEFAWYELKENGLTNLPSQEQYDLNKDSEIDVADVQIALSHWGEALPVNGTTPEVQDLSLSVDEAAAPTLATIEVNSNGDAADSDINDGKCLTADNKCTLRAAVQNANRSVDDVLITFAIPPNDGSVVTIISDGDIVVENQNARKITINGYTQSGAQENTGPVTGNAQIKVQLEGKGVLGAQGFYIQGENNTIKGLAIYNFDYNILIGGPNASGNKIEGNFIGTNVAQDFDMEAPAFDTDGIRVEREATNNTIGGTSLAQRNIISGNDQDGLGIQGAGTDNNKAFNNYIGLKQDGITPWPNDSDGVDIAEDAKNNQIGGLEAGQRNVIGGNWGDGIEISHGKDEVGNSVLGNFIGLGANGSTLVPNAEKGVTLEDQPNQTQVERNIIVGNKHMGIRVQSANANTIKNNFIGVYPPGLGPADVVPTPSDALIGSLVDAPNGQAPERKGDDGGIYLYGGSSSNKIIGNVISNHPAYGVWIDANPSYLGTVCTPYFNTISKNWIYENGGLGIYLDSSSDCGEISYPNQNIQPPVLTSVDTTTVQGTACANCTVEIFIADGSDNAGEGKFFRGSGSADGAGNFKFNLVQAVTIGDLLTATATDSNGNTSQFATNVLVTKEGTAPIPTPTPTPEPTPNPSLKKHLYMPLVVRQTP